MAKLNRKEVSEALSERYRGKDLYAPEADPAQQTANFKPQEIKGEACDTCNERHVPGMCEGGGFGMSGGGQAPMNLDLKKGALHKDLGVPEDELIPQKKLSKALNSNSELERKRAQFAENAKHWQHKNKGGPIKMWGAGEVPGISTDQPMIIPTDEDIANSSVGNAPITSNPPPPIGQQAVSAPAAQNQATPGDYSAFAPKGSGVMAPATAQPQAAQSKLGPDELQILISALTAKPTTTQRVGRGLAAFGQGIINSMGKSSSPDYLSASIQSQQQQKENLINALNAKYKGQELEMNLRKTKADIDNERAERDQAAKALAQEKTLKTRELNQNAEKSQTENQLNAAKLPVSHWYNPLSWNSDANNANAALRTQILGGQNNAHPQDAQAITWAKSHPSDPRAAKILKANGQ